MMNFESDEHAQQPQKRSRKSNSGEDAAGGKKARGRPRVDTHDATAADVSGHLFLALTRTDMKFVA